MLDNEVDATKIIQATVVLATFERANDSSVIAHRSPDLLLSGVALALSLVRPELT